jgi:hypothetical protein
MTLNPMSTMSTHKSLVYQKKDPLKQQNDPFLRDLTACLQMKQQQRRLTEAIHSSDNSYSSSNSEKSNGSFSSSFNQIESNLNLEVNNNVNNKQRFNLNLSLNQNVSNASSTNEKFAKPSFISNSQISSNKEAPIKSYLEFPSIKIRSISPSSSSMIQPPPTANTPKTNGTYSVKIKTPIMDRKCILNISCQTNSNEPQLAEASTSSISTLASATFLNAASILKLDEGRKDHLKIEDLPQQQKFKSPPIMVTPIVTKPIVLISQKLQTIDSSKTLEKDDTVFKTKLNQLKSFNFNSNTGTNAETMAPNKIYSTTSTQTNVLTNSVSTNTDNCFNPKGLSKSNKTPQNEPIQFDVKLDDQKSEQQTQTVDIDEEETAKETTVSLYKSEKKLSNATTITSIHESKLDENSLKKLCIDPHELIRQILSHSQFNANDLVIIKKNFLQILIESSSLSKIQRNLNVRNHGFLRSLSMLNDNMLNDIKFIENKKVSVVF